MKRIPCQIEKQVQMCHTEKQNFDLIRMHLFILTKVDSVANCSLHSHRANIRRLSVLQSSALWLQAPAAKKHLFILNFFFSTRRTKLACQDESATLDSFTEPSIPLEIFSADEINPLINLFQLVSKQYCRRIDYWFHSWSSRWNFK